MQSFQPIKASTVAVAASTSSSSGAIARQPTGSHQLRIANIGASLGRYAVGDSTVVATAASPALPAGAVEVVTVRNNSNNPETHVAFLTDSGTTTMEITTGHGL